MSDNSLAVQSDKRIDIIKNTVMSPSVKERFSEMMGPNAIYYLNQVMILVANSADLQACSPKSILISAMRAASLRLSLDPSTGQAWLVPYKGIATFQIGYKGIYELAMRTNLYRFINIFAIYQGEEITQNRMTGIHSIGGQRSSDEITHYMLYFELTNGFKKTFCMSVDEIEKHAETYSPGYSNFKSPWKDPNKRPVMQMKTVLANGLRRWGRFNDGDVQIINEIEEVQGWQDRQAELPQAFSDLPISDVPEISEPASEPKEKPWTSEKITKETAMSAKSISGKLYWSMSTADLERGLVAINETIAKNHMTDEKRESAQYNAAVISAILDYRKED